MEGKTVGLHDSSMKVDDEPGDISSLARCNSATCEHVRFDMLDDDAVLIGSLRIGGESHHVDLPLRLIAQAMAHMSPRYMVMVHNHPSGDARPSRKDIDATRRIWRLARTLGVSLHDHRIETETSRFSFRDNGLL